MDEELRELEETIRKVISAYAKVFRFSGDFTSVSWRFIQPQGEKLKNYIKNRKAQSTPKGNLKDIINQSSNHLLVNFRFTGQETDLCYFYQSDRMPLSAIVNLEDEYIKNSVVECFSKLIDTKYLKLKDGNIYITQKGKNYINNDFFATQAKADQLQAYNNTFVQSLKDNDLNCVELSGDNKKDFTFFNHSDNLDLVEIKKSPNSDIAEKILNNVKDWQRKGAVTVENGIATVTEKGKNMLTMPEFKRAVRGISEKSAETVKVTSRSVIVSTKKAVETTVQQSVLKNTVTKAIKR